MPELHEGVAAEATSFGRMMRPRSSIHTDVGTLMMP
jgi:hypothetical protein